MRKLFLILMTLAASAWSVTLQAKTVRGTVVDAANDEPLIGATVMPVGGGQGVATDLDGHFTLNVPDNVKTAKFTYVGYKEATVALKEGMVVGLHASDTSLDEVVVVAYGTANKESLTGSVAVVGAAEIEDRPVTSVTAALEGNAPGVQVNNSTGAPGSSPSIRIRGFNSFDTGAQSPLYVVDGAVFSGDIAELNPADIESMSVLKDAASCALYGSRGANGVILITTKRAKGTGKVDVTATVRLGAYTRGLPFYDRLDPAQWSEQSVRALANGKVVNAGGTYEDALKSTLSSFINSYCRKTNVFDAPADEIFDENGNVIAALNGNYTDLDWWDAVSQTGFRQEYNLNATGATEKFNVFSSISYLKENGYMLKTDYERFTGRVTANYNPVDYLRTGVNVSTNYVKSMVGEADSGNLNSATNPFLTMFKAPIAPYYQHEEDGTIKRDAAGNPLWKTDGLNDGDNVAWVMRLNDNNYTGLTLDASAYATAVIPYGFELTVRGQMYRTKGSQNSYSNNIVGSQAGMGGFTYSFSSNKSYTFNQALTWDHQYGDHHIDALLSHENFKYAYDSGYIVMGGQLLDGIYALSNFKETEQTGQSINGYGTESYLGRARYNYDQKYFGEVSINRDGSSQFAPDKRWGTFWSVGAGWIISKEKFMSAATWVDFLKLRLAYGSVGNNQACGYQNYLNLYSLYNNTGLIPVQIAAPDLRWEATKTLDVALEGNLFNDRFNFSIGYYNKINSDLIYSLTLPSSAGTLGGSGSNPSILTNIGEMTNHGWELQFGVDIIRNRNVKWDFNIDFSFNTNKISRLPDGRNIIGQAFFQGYSLFEKYTYTYAGVDQMTGRALYDMEPYSWDYNVYDENNNWVYDASLYEAQKAEAIKDGSYVEINGHPYTYKTQYAGRKIQGSALPIVFGSFSSSVQWKGLKAGFMFTYSLGGKTFDSNYQSLMSFSSQNPGALHKDILNAWTAAPEGMTADSPDRIDPNGVPQINSAYAEYNDTSSSRFLVSSSYLTLKNINISYDLPRKWVSAMKLQNINVGFFMDNVFIVAAKKGMNPTYGFAGGQGAYYVPNRTYSFQLSVKF